jgi:hypothetical protein
MYVELGVSSSVIDPVLSYVLDMNFGKSNVTSRFPVQGLLSDEIDWKGVLSGSRIPRHRSDAVIGTALPKPRKSKETRHSLSQLFLHPIYSDHTNEVGLALVN